MKPTPEQALRYAMSVPGVTTTITGMPSLETLRQNLRIAQNFTPMSAAEMQQVVAAVAPFAGDGRFEQYKTSLRYDALLHLQTLPAADFDQSDALQQIGDHLATMSAFQTEIDNGTDPQLKAFARKWLPTIQSHLELAVDLSGHIAGASPFKRR